MTSSNSDASNIDAELQAAFDEIDDLIYQKRDVDIEDFVARFPKDEVELRQYLETVASLIDVPGLAITTGISDPTLEIEPGDPIEYIGNYEVVEEIARGGMGVVYKARQPSLGRIVALKMILSGPDASAEDQARFHREAKNIAALNHPGIVKIHERDEFKGLPFYVMEFVDGVDLRERIQGDEPFGELAAAGVLLQAAEAVHYAHECGVLHRDLKPANLMLDNEGSVKITDFGLAKQLDGEDDLTRTGSVMGTLRYMPPEQAMGNLAKLSMHSDVFSLGAIFYELLTGRPAFWADQQGRLHDQVCNMEPVSPRRLNPVVSRDAETICLKCLEKRPEQRYTTAGELALDLKLLIDGKPIKARPVSLIERLYRWTFRNPAIASLVTALLLAIVIGSGCSIYFGVRATYGEMTALRLAEDKTQLAEDKAKLAQQEAEARKKAQRQSQLAEREAYNAQLTYIETLLNRDRRLARELLDDPTRCPWRLRDFTWRHFRASVEEETVLRPFLDDRRNAHAPSLCFSPTGEKILLSHNEGYIWDLTSGQMLHRLERDVDVASFIGLEAMVFVSRIEGANHRNVIIDSKSGAIDFELPDNSRVLSLSASANLAVLMADKRKCKLLQIDDFEVLAEIEVEFDLQGAETSRDGKRIAVWGKGSRIQVWDVGKKELVAETEIVRGDLTDWTVSPSHSLFVKFSGDGTTVIMAQAGSATREHPIESWELATGARRTLSSIKYPIYAIDVSPDGNTIAVARSPRRTVISSQILEHHAIELRSINTGQLLAELSGHRTAVTAVRYSEDGAKLASLSRNGELRIWRMDLGRTYETPGTEAIVSSDGRRIATQNKSVIELRDCFSNEQLYSVAGNRPVFSADATRMAFYDPLGSAIRIVSCENGAEIAKFSIDGVPRFLKFSPDSKSLATALQGVVRVWAVGDNKPLAEFKTEASSTSFLWFGKDATSLIVLDHKPSLTRWDLASGRKVYTSVFSPTNLEANERSHDGRWLAIAGSDRVVRIVDTETGRQVATVNVHGSVVRGLAFTQANELFICSERQVQVWSPVGSNVSSRIDTNANVLGKMAVSPDGQALATLGYNDEIILWDAETGARRGVVGPTHIGYIRGPSPLGFGSLKFSHNSQQLICVGSDKIIRIWGRSTGNRIARIAAHTGGVVDIHWSASGDSWVTTGQDARGIIRGDYSGKIEQEFDLLPTRPQGGLPKARQMELLDDGQLAVLKTNGVLRTWDCRAHVNTQVMDCSERVLQFSVAKQSQRIAGLLSDQRTIVIWDGTMGREVRRFSGDHGKPFAISPNGNRVAKKTGTNSIAIWDCVRKAKIATLHTKEYSWPDKIEFIDEDRIVSTHTSDPGAVVLWEANTGKRLAAHRFGIPKSLAVANNAVYVLTDRQAVSIDSSDFSIRARHDLPRHTDHRRVFVNGDAMGVAVKRDPGLAFFNIARGEFDNRFLPNVAHWEEIAISDDGVLAWSDEDDVFIKMAPDLEARRLPRDPNLNRGRVSRAEPILAATAGRAVVLRSTVSGEILHELPAQQGLTTCLSFHNNGGVLASASINGEVHLWDTATGDKKNTWDAGIPIIAIRLIGQRVIAVAATGEVARFTIDGKPLDSHTLHVAPIRSACIYDDGDLIACVGATGCEVLHLNERSGTYTLKGDQQFTSIAIVNDATIAAGGRDGQIAIWRYAEGENVTELGRDENSVDALAVSPNGQELLSGNANGYVSIWRLP